MTENSAYSVLEITESASKAEVKSAFKSLSLKHHPDKNNNSEESAKKFIEIRAAYEAIIDDLDDKKKSDNFTSDYQDKDHTYETDDDPFWNNYFASKRFKKFKAKFSENFNKQGFINYEIETYDLLNEGEFFTTKATTTYIAVRDCKSLAEIGLDIKSSKAMVEKEIAQVQNDIILENALHRKLSGESLIAALKGTIAAHDLDKFFGIAMNINSSKVTCSVGFSIIFDVIEAVLSEAELSQIEEDKLTTMIKHLVEEKKLVTNDEAIKQAAKAGFYNVAQYLIDHGSTTNNLSPSDLFNFEGTKDNFEAFKWLKDHGIKVKTATIPKVICYGKLAFKLLSALKNNSNIELAKDFFVRENISSLEEINNIEQDCEYFANLKNSWNEEPFLISAINSGKTSYVQRLLDYGVELKLHVDDLYNISPEMLGFIISKMDNLQWSIFTDDNAKLLTKTIQSGSVDNVKTLLDKGIPLYTNTYLSLHHTTPEIAEVVLNQMHGQKFREGSSLFNCERQRPHDRDSYEKFYHSFSPIYCKKYSYNLDTPQNCQVGELVADYLGETDQIDWSICQ